MTKDEAILILKRKIKESEVAAKEEHYGKLTQTAISSYESGKAQGLSDALAIIGMIENNDVAKCFDEQKSAWNEEDEHRLKDTIYFLDTAKKHYATTVELDACINWLKSIKQRNEN